MESDALPPKESEISETTENYLKRIYILTESKGRARISDIAKLMNRSLSSVSEAVKRMGEEGYLNYEKYGKITLTPMGNEIAKGVHLNYSVLNDLLLTLGLPPHLAMEDACSMEHQISETTIRTIEEFVKFANENEIANRMIKKFINEVNPVEMPAPPEEDDDEEED